MSFCDSLVSPSVLLFDWHFYFTSLLFHELGEVFPFFLILFYSVYFFLFLLPSKFGITLNVIYIYGFMKYSVSCRVFPFIFFKPFTFTVKSYIFNYLVKILQLNSFYVPKFTNIIIFPYSFLLTKFKHNSLLFFLSL